MNPPIKAKGIHTTTTRTSHPIQFNFKKKTFDSNKMASSSFKFGLIFTVSISIVLLMMIAPHFGSGNEKFPHLFAELAGIHGRVACDFDEFVQLLSIQTFVKLQHWSGNFVTFKCIK
jgi:hypothetical protein